MKSFLKAIVFDRAYGRRDINRSVWYLESVLRCAWESCKIAHKNDVLKVAEFFIAGCGDNMRWSLLREGERTGRQAISLPGT